MPMAAAGNQVPLGDKLYFFTSPVATDKCLIWGHGGLLHGDGMYNLPEGLTIHYYVPHGQPRVSNPTMGIRAGTLGQEPGHHTAGPAAIPNYTLRKGVGSGWSGEAFSYHDIERKMNDNGDYVNGVGGDWCPHVVSVRRRFKLIGKSINLGEIIDAVIAHDPNITQFYYGACRGDYSGSRIKSGLIRAAVEVLR